MSLPKIAFVEAKLATRERPRLKCSHAIKKKGKGEEAGSEWALRATTTTDLGFRMVVSREYLHERDFRRRESVILREVWGGEKGKPNRHPILAIRDYRVLLTPASLVEEISSALFCSKISFTREASSLSSVCTEIRILPFLILPS